MAPPSHRIAARCIPKGSAAEERGRRSLRAIARAVIGLGSEEADAEHTGLGLSLIYLQLLVIEPDPAYPRCTFTYAVGPRRAIGRMYPLGPPWAADVPGRAAAHGRCFLLVVLCGCLGRDSKQRRNYYKNLWREEKDRPVARGLGQDNSKAVN